MSIKGNLSLGDARMIFRNFSGKESQFNTAGRRSFGVLIDEETAQLIEQDGWNVKWLRPRDDQEDPQAFLPVGLNFSNYPPKIMVISGSGKTMLDEDSVQLLDWAEIENLELVLRPYAWEVNGKSGIKAYVKSMYVTLVEDEFEAKYRNIPFNEASTDEPPWEDD